MKEKRKKKKDKRKKEKAWMKTKGKRECIKDREINRQKPGIGKKGNDESTD